MLRHCESDHVWQTALIIALTWSQSVKWRIELHIFRTAVMIIWDRARLFDMCMLMLQYEFRHTNHLVGREYCVLGQSLLQLLTLASIAYYSVNRRRLMGVANQTAHQMPIRPRVGSIRVGPARGEIMIHQTKYMYKHITPVGAKQRVSATSAQR